MANKDFFDPKTVDWQRTPDQAFANWLKTQKGRRKGAKQLKVSSAEIYMFQWNKFLAFLAERNVLVTEASAKDVTDFLATLIDTNSSQRERYRSLLERVFRHLYGKDRTYNDRVNPASRLSQGMEGNRWKTLDKNMPMGFLTSSEYTDLVSYLTHSDRSTGNVTVRRRRLRDRAMVAVYLGAGLKVHHALRMTVNDISLPDALQITFQEVGSKFIHQVRVQPFASSLLKQWLAARQEWAGECAERGRDVGNLVFPGGIADPARLTLPEGKESPDTHGGTGSWIDDVKEDEAADALGGAGARLIGRAMNPATALRVCEAVIAGSGIYERRQIPPGETSAERISPQTLRNTFAATLFAEGQTTLAVMGQLGFADELSASRLKTAWDSWRSFHE